MIEALTLVSQLSSIKLERGKQGSYGWTIHVYGQDLNKVKAEVARINKWMEKKYGDKKDQG